MEHRAAAPLLPPRVLADRDRAASIIALTLASAGIYSVFLFLTYYLQTVQAYPPVRTGLAFLPMVATTITGAVLGANVLLTRIGPRLTLPLGMLASAAGLAWLTRLTVTSSYPAAILGPLLILGLGLGLIFAPAISLGTARLRGQDTGVGSALVNTTQQVGGAVGITLLSPAPPRRHHPSPPAARRRPRLHHRLLDRHRHRHRRHATATGGPSPRPAGHARGPACRRMSRCCLDCRARRRKRYVSSPGHRH
jgi:Major Facilitator Superfamily